MRGLSRGFHSNVEPRSGKIARTRIRVAAACDSVQKGRFTSLLAQPVGNVVHDRTEGAGRKCGPENAEQQRRVCALQAVNVDRMRHGPFNSSANLMFRCAKLQDRNGKAGLRLMRGSIYRLRSRYAA